MMVGWLLAGFFVEFLRVQHNFDVAVPRKVRLRGLLNVFDAYSSQHFLNSPKIRGYSPKDIAAIVAQPLSGDPQAA